MEYEPSRSPLTMPEIVPEKKFSPEEMDEMFKEALDKLGITPAIMDPNFRRKKTYEKTDEELWRTIAFFRPNLDIEPYRLELQKLRVFSKQIEETEGFGGDEMPDLPDYPGPGGVCIAECCPHRSPENYKTYKELAEFAIQKYNEDHDTDYKVLKVERVNECVEFVGKYYITFTAIGDSGDDTNIFQAIVRACMSGIYAFKEVDLCRIKYYK